MVAIVEEGALESTDVNATLDTEAKCVRNKEFQFVLEFLQMIHGFVLAAKDFAMKLTHVCVAIIKGINVK